MSPGSLVVDFDSTFVSVEALDELARITLTHHPNRDQILVQLIDLTAQGMEGRIGFAESLRRRLDLFAATKDHVDTLINFLNLNITASITQHQSFFQANSNYIYIISGGFTDYIWPVVNPFGLERSHILANSFIYDYSGHIIGYDPDCPLAQDNGKVKQLQLLNLPHPITVVGDGFTDYAIKKGGLAEQFVVFTENVRRPTIVKLADQVASNFDQVINYITLA